MVEIPFDPRSPQSRAVIVGFYPAPIAHAFHRATNANAGSVDLAYAELQSVLLAYLALVALRAAPASEPVVQSTLKQLRSKNAADGLWVQALREASKRIDQEHLVQVLGAHAELDGSFAGSTLNLAVDEIVTLRNKVIHEKRYDLREPWQRALHRTLDLLSDLRFQAVLVPSEFKGLRGKLRSYKATAYKGIEVNAHVAIETDLELVPGRAYLWREGFSDVLALHPFVVEVSPDGGGPLSELFVLQSLNRAGALGTRDGNDAGAVQHAEIVQALEDLSASMDGASAWLKPGRFACPSLSATSGRRLAAGELFAARFSIVRHLGSGAAADVYAARDTRDNTEVALKLLPVELARSQELLARFHKEYAVAHKLNHPCLVRYLSKGEDLGSHYIVAELASGWEERGERAFDLRHYLALVKDAGQSALDEALVRGILGHVAQALAELHAQGIVHRDVKPANVFLFEGAGPAGAVTPQRAQHVKLGDLGIARQRGDSTLTLTGVPLGTAEYMPPEQSDDDRVAATMDVYAFGVIAYELLVGEPPFRGRTPQETRAKFYTRRKRLLKVAPHVSPNLARFIEKCLSWEPTERFPNGTEVYAALSRVDRELEVRPSTVDIARGQVLGNYRVLELEARIPGASLFRARDDRTGARVRVGILIDEIEESQARHEAALKRLALLQSVNKESLVRVREYGQENNYTWFLLEDVGEALDPATATIGDVIEVARSVLVALSSLHALGIVHGNVAESIRNRRAEARAVAENEPTDAAGMLDVPASELAPGCVPNDDLRALVEWSSQAMRAARSTDAHEDRVRARILTRLAAFDRAGGTRRGLDHLLARASQDVTLRGVRRGPWHVRRAWSACRRHPYVTVSTVLLACLSLGLVLRPIVQRKFEQADLQDRVRNLTYQAQYPAAARALAENPRLIENDLVLTTFEALLPMLEDPESVTPRHSKGLRTMAGLLNSDRRSAITVAEDVLRGGNRRFVKWVRVLLEQSAPIAEEDREVLWKLEERMVGSVFSDSKDTAEALAVQLDLVHIACQGATRPDLPTSSFGIASMQYSLLVAVQLLFEHNKPPESTTDREEVELMFELLACVRRWPVKTEFEVECYTALAEVLHEYALGSMSEERVTRLLTLGACTDLDREVNRVVAAYFGGRNTEKNRKLMTPAVHEIAQQCLQLEQYLRPRIETR